MPTYDYRCPICFHEVAIFQSISEYCRAPLRPGCCVPEMERKLSVNPAMSGLANALAGDRHYDGMIATDGTPIDSRTKHRQYMKNNNLTTMDDFKNTWKDAARDRELRRLGEKKDPEIRKLVTEQVMKAVAQPGD